MPTVGMQRKGRKSLPVKRSCAKPIWKRNGAKIVNQTVNTLRPIPKKRGLGAPRLNRNRDYKERKSASAKRHYQASKDQIKARVNLYRAQNIDAVRERGRKYYAANAERRKQYERDYRAANPEKMRAANAIKKAHRRSLGRIPYGWFRKQLVIQNHRCNGCLVGLTTDGSTKPRLTISSLSATAERMRRTICKSCALLAT